MKKILSVFIMSILISTRAFAGYSNYSHSSHSSNNTSPAPVQETFVDTDTQRQRYGFGVGYDLTVLRNDNWVVSEVALENRYDITNREYRGYVVGKGDLTKLFGE